MWQVDTPTSDSLQATSTRIFTLLLKGSEGPCEATCIAFWLTPLRGHGNTGCYSSGPRLVGTYAAQLYPRGCRGVPWDYRHNLRPTPLCKNRNTGREWHCPGILVPPSQPTPKEDVMTHTAVRPCLSANTGPLFRGHVSST